MNNIFLSVDFSTSYMWITNCGFVEKGFEARIFTYYFCIPRSWEADFELKIFQFAKKMYSDFDTQMQFIEDGFPHHFSVKSTKARILTSNEMNSKPWAETEIPSWEMTNCVFIGENNDYVKLQHRIFYRLFEYNVIPYYESD